MRARLAGPKQLVEWQRSLRQGLRGSTVRHILRPAMGQARTGSERSPTLTGIPLDFVYTDCRHGMMFLPAADTTIGGLLRYYGEWGEREIALLSRFVRPGDTVFDVGANIGCHTLAFSRMVGETGRVVAFEPFATNFSCLNFSVRLNGLSNVLMYNCLVDDHNQLRIFDGEKVAPIGDNFGAVSYFRAIHGGGEVSVGDPVAAMRLDILAQLHPKLIKIDVEGMEPAVLAGARVVIEADRPIIYFEQNGPARYTECRALLESYDYKLFWHRPALFNPANYRAAPNHIGDAAELNVLAVPPDRLDGLAGLNLIEATETFDPPPTPESGPVLDWAAKLPKPQPIFAARLA